MKKLRISLTAGAIVGTLAAVALVGGPANASATVKSGSTTLSVTGSGLTVNSSYTSYTGSATGPTVTGEQWAANGNHTTITVWNIGSVCVNGTWKSTSGAWKASGNTTYYGQWKHNAAWDSNKPAIGIHS